MEARIQGPLARASEVVSRFGLRGLLAEGIDKVVLRRISLQIVHVMGIDADAIRPHPIESGFDLRWLEAGEIERAARDPQNAIGAAFAARAARRRDLCFAVLRGDRIASSGWYALGSADREDAAGTALGLPPDTVYLYKGFTHPDFRGRGLYPAGIAAALAALRPRGVTRAVELVHWSNEAALRSSHRLGFQPLGRLVVGPWGPLRIPAAARRAGLRFGTRAAKVPIEGDRAGGAPDQFRRE